MEASLATNTPVDERASDTIVRGACPARLSRHVCDARHNSRRKSHSRRRRPGSPLHSRISLRESESLRRAHVSHGSPDASTPAHRQERRGTLRAHHLGRGARRGRGAARRHRPLRRRPAVDSPLLVLRYARAHPGRHDGSSLFPSPRRIDARSHDLLDGGRSGTQDDAGREHRRRSRGNAGERSRSPVGHQHAHVESTSLALRARGPCARRPHHRHRPAPHAHRRPVR